MEFIGQKAIYLQIVDYICEQILKKEKQEGDRIASIRELAVSIEVNPNTVVRSYAYLEEHQIIVKQRGVGYFIAEGAYHRTVKLKKDYFLKQELPEVFKTMSLLNVELQELQTLYMSHHKGGQDENK